MKLSEVIKNYRESNQITIRAFAKKCEISTGYASMLENGVQPTTGKPIVPSVETLIRLAKGMDMSLYELLAQIDKSQRVSFPSDYLAANNDEEKSLLEIFRSLDDSKKAELFDLIKKLM